MRWRLALATTLLTSLLATGAAWAQEIDAPQPEPGSVALNQFDPAPAGDAFFGIPSPYAHGTIFEPRAELVFDAAEQPLKLRDEVSSGSVVGRQLTMHVAASAAIVDRVLFDVLFPVALIQRGESPTIQGVNVTSPDSTQPGDLRLGLRLRLFGDVGSPFQIGTGAYLFTPTGSRDLADGAGAAYVGEGKVRVQPYASFGGRFHALVPWLWTVYGGALIRNSDNPSSVRYGAGFAALLHHEVIQLGPEFYASTPVQTTQHFKATPTDSLELEATTNVELLLGFKVRVWRFLAGVAAGPGMTKAIGTPTYRIAWSLAYDPKPETSANVDTGDADEDGIDDDQDACPYAFGPKSDEPANHGCPLIDDDEDGVPNDRDACPKEPGIASDVPSKNGCAPRVED